MRTKQKNLHGGVGTFRIATTLMLGAALTLAYACADNRRVEQQIDDGNLTSMLGAKYAFDSEIDRYRIDIDVKNGVVTLRGFVSNEEQRQEAERIAQGTRGVRSVVNNLKVDPTPRTAEQVFEDGWIVTMIGSKLAVDPEVRKMDIDVDVREGMVTLSGTVDSETAKNEAEDLAWSVDGVKNVTNEIVVRE